MKPCAISSTKAWGKLFESAEVGPRLPPGLGPRCNRQPPALAGAEALLLKFVAHHLWSAEQRENDPAHGMPAEVELNLRQGGFLRVSGPHAASTVRRRLAHWSTLTKWRGLEGAFASPALKSAIRFAVRAAPRPRQRKSRRALTADIVLQLIAACGTDSRRDLRDRAILMVAFGSGGRRRSEIASLRHEQITEEDPVELADGTKLPSISIHLGRTKTSDGSREEIVYLTGGPVTVLNEWLLRARISKGSVFRAIDRWGNVSRRAIDPQAINAIVKERAAMAGLEPADYSAHGLRSGFLTEAALRNISLLEAMDQSRHRSIQQAGSYYNSATRSGGRAARLL